MSSRRRTVGLTVTSGLVLTVLAPIGPLSLPDALGMDPVGRDMPRAVAAEPAAPPATMQVETVPVVERPPSRPVTTPKTRLLPDAQRGPKCDRTQVPSKKKARYHGRSVSRLYDKIFRPGPEIPHLSGYIPQGLSVWRDWDGKGNTLLLLGMYRKGSQSYIVGINPRTGRHVGTVRVKASHLGAVGVSGKWLIAQDTEFAGQEPAVRKYRLSKLRSKMARSHATSTKPYMVDVGKPQKIHAASYMFVEGDSIWIGRYARSAKPKMYRYSVDSKGDIRQEDGPWAVPLRTQGVMVTEDHFVFTSSLGGQRGRMIVVRRAKPTRLSEPVACLWTPSLPQNMTVYRGRMLTAFESGATRFDKKSTRNKISHLHVGRVDDLIRITDPASLNPFYAPAAPVELPDDLIDAPEEIDRELAGGGLSADRMAERAAAARASSTPTPAPEAPVQEPPVQEAPQEPAEQEPAEDESSSDRMPLDASEPAEPAEPESAQEQLPSESADPEFGIEAGPGVRPEEDAEAAEQAPPDRISDARITDRAENNPNYQPPRSAFLSPG